MNKVAHIQNHHTLPSRSHSTLFDGHEGSWIKNQILGRLFISKENGTILFPIELRGKSSKDITEEDISKVNPEETGDKLYHDWLMQQQNNIDAKQLYNGHEWTETGIKYLMRLKKILSATHTVDMKLFDKMQSSNNIESIKQLAKTIGKQYRKMQESKVLKPEENQDDNDLVIQKAWGKLISVFSFDPWNWQPKIDTPEDVHYKKLKKTFSEFMLEVKPLLDAQMADVTVALSVIGKAIEENNETVILKAWQTLKKILMENIKNYYFHNLGTSSVKIMELPEYHQICSLLFNMK